MKRISLIGLLFVAVATITNAQSFLWGRQNAGTPPFYDMAEVGHSIFGTGSGILLSRCDVTGKAVWIETVNIYMGGQFIKTDPEGFIYVAGYFNGNATIATQSGNVTLRTRAGDIFLAKLDTEGHILWINQSTSSDGIYLTALEKDNNGNMVLSGNFDANINLGANKLSPSGGFDAFVTSVSPGGKFLWAKQVGGTGNDYIAGILKAPNGSLIINGYYTNDAKFDTRPAPTTHSETGFLAEINPATGSVNWIKTDTTLFFNHLSVINQNTEIYSDVTFKGSLLVWGTTLHSTGAKGYALVKLDTGFNKLSATAINFEPQFALFADDGTATLAGSFFDSVRINDRILYKSLGMTDIYLASYDNNGHLSWSLHTGGQNYDIISGMALSADRNSVFVSGGIKSGPANFGSVTIPGDLSGSGFILKMDAPFSAILHESYNNSCFLLYPNPVSTGFVHLKPSDGLPYSDVIKTEIYTIEGQLIQNSVLKPENEGIDVRHLKAGVYLVKLQCNTCAGYSRVIVQ